MCVSVFCGLRVSSGLPQGQGLGVQQIWVWHKPSWSRSPLTHHRAARTYTGLGKQTLGGAQTKPHAHQDLQKEAVAPQETDPDLPVSRSLQGRRGLAMACGRVGGTECGSVCLGLSEGGPHYLHHLHHSLASGQTRRREHSPSHQQKIGLKIQFTEHGPAHQNKTQFPP